MLGCRTAISDVYEVWKVVLKTPLEARREVLVEE